MKKNKKKYINKKTQNTFNMPCLYPTALNAVCKLHRISSANRGSHRIFLDSVYYYMLSHFSQQMESMHYSPHLLTARWEFRWPEARDTVLTRWFNDVKNIMFFTEKQQVVNWFQTSHEEDEIDLVFNMMEVEHQKNFIKTYTDAVAFVNRPECIDVEPQSIEHVGYDDIENAMTDTDIDSDDSMPSLIENSDEEEDSEEEDDESPERFDDDDDYSHLESNPFITVRRRLDFDDENFDVVINDIAADILANGTTGEVIDELDLREVFDDCAPVDDSDFSDISEIDSSDDSSDESDGEDIGIRV